MSGNFVCGDLTCTGCGACADACPFEALAIRELEPFGELTPSVDPGKCRDCGRCHAICPARNPIALRMPIKTYAAWSNEASDVERSSSGGIATALARKIIADGGVVFGASVGSRMARCIAVERSEDLESLRGSKYVYSAPLGAYKHAKNLLAEGRQVLFISTPCQVGALRALVDDRHARLLCVDLICHGTPSIALLQEHLDHIVDNQWDSFSFRGINDFHMCAYRDGELVFDKPCFEDEFFSAFVAGFIHRDACYECPYARNQRVGDITLGDFWGLDKSLLRFVPPGKVSLALCNTQAGITALEELPSSVHLEERKFSEADNKEQTNLHEPSPRTRDRLRFAAAFRKTDFEAAVHKTWAWKRFKLRAMKHGLMRMIRR